jgi:hypothetical protein
MNNKFLIVLLLSIFAVNIADADPIEQALSIFNDKTNNSAYQTINTVHTTSYETKSLGDFQLSNIPASSLPLYKCGTYQTVDNTGDRTNRCGSNDFSYLNSDGHYPYAKYFKNPKDVFLPNHNFDDILYRKTGILKVNKLNYIYYSFDFTNRNAYLKLYRTYNPYTSAQVANYIGWSNRTHKILVYNVFYEVNGKNYKTVVPLNFFFTSKSKFYTLSEVTLDESKNTLYNVYRAQTFKINGITESLMQVSQTPAKIFQQVKIENEYEGYPEYTYMPNYTKFLDY